MKQRLILIGALLTCAHWCIAAPANNGEPAEWSVDYTETKWDAFVFNYIPEQDSEGLTIRQTYGKWEMVDGEPVYTPNDDTYGSGHPDWEWYMLTIGPDFQTIQGQDYIVTIYGKADREADCELFLYWGWDEGQYSEGEAHFTTEWSEIQVRYCGVGEGGNFMIMRPGTQETEFKIKSVKVEHRPRALPGETFVIDGLRYIVNEENTTVSVDANESNTSSSIDIPAEVSCNDCDYTVTKIGYQAFCGNETLLSINLPNTLQEIDSYAFAFTHLTSITIPENVTKIVDWAFAGCAELESVNFEGSQAPDVFRGFNDSSPMIRFYGQFVSDDNRLIIDNGTLRACSLRDLEWYAFPEGITRIAPGAFEDVKLESIVLPQSVETIDWWGFSGCAAHSITLRENVHAISGNFIIGCDNLEILSIEVTDPSAITIEWDTFDNFSNFETCRLSVPEGCADLYRAAEGWNQFANIEEHCPIAVSDGIAYEIRVGDNCATVPCQWPLRNYDIQWQDYNTRTEFTVSDLVEYRGQTYPVTWINAQAFYDCWGITEITIPSSVVDLDGWGTFQHCWHLSRVNFSEGLQKMGVGTFYDVWDLREVELPSTLCEVGNIFHANNSIKAVTIHATTPPVYNGNYDGNYSDIDFDFANATLYVPAGCKVAYATDSYWGMFGTIVEQESTDPHRFVAADIDMPADKLTLLPVEMVNEHDIIGMQFDVVLPEGFALAQNSKGRYYLEGSDRFDDHNVNAQDVDGAVRFVVVSPTNTEFDGHDGVVFSLPVIATGEPRHANILIRDILITDTGFEEIAVAPLMVTANVKPAYTVGDVNNDGKFTVTDVTLVVAYVLGNDPANGIREAADANGDGRLTVTDVTIVVSYVLGQQQPKAPSRAKAVESEVSVAERSELALNDNGIVELSVSGLSACTSAQFDITLSEGAAVRGVSLRGDQDHVVNCRTNADGTVRVVAYSPTNSDFAADAAFEVAVVPGASTDWGEGRPRPVEMSVGDIRLAQVSGNAVAELAAEGCSASLDLSGVADAMVAGLDIKAVAGALVVTAPAACDITLYDTLGRGCRHALAPGANRISLPRGVYMLAGRKLVIR